MTPILPVNRRGPEPKQAATWSLTRDRVACGPPFGALTRGANRPYSFAINRKSIDQESGGRHAAAVARRPNQAAERKDRMGRKSEHGEDIDHFDGDRRRDIRACFVDRRASRGV